MSNPNDMPMNIIMYLRKENLCIFQEKLTRFIKHADDMADVEKYVEPD